MSEDRYAAGCVRHPRHTVTDNASASVTVAGTAEGRPRDRYRTDIGRILDGRHLSSVRSPYHRSGRPADGSSVPPTAAPRRLRKWEGRDATKISCFGRRHALSRG